MMFYREGEIHPGDTRNDPPKKISELMLEARERGEDFAYKGETDEGRFALYSSTGSVKSKNEDALGVLRENGLFAVADGIGGNLGGQEASKIAVIELEKQAAAGERLDSGAIEKKIKESIVAAGNRDPLNKKGMGTTMAVFQVEGGRMRTMHTGDCRIYVYGGEGKFKYISRDQSLVQEKLNRKGKMRANAERLKRFEHNFGMKNVVMTDFIHGEVYTEMPPSREMIKIKDQASEVSPEGRIISNEAERVEEIELAAGDIVIACSDGMNDMLLQKEIDQLVRDYGGEAATLRSKLAVEALHQGGYDNISIIVYRHGKEA